ncbi:MAG: PAQR family membrane homeostasis protein TrhA [Cytophagaceae bacterium]
MRAHKEELINWTSHAAGLFLGIAGFFILLYNLSIQDSILKVSGVVVYGLSIIFLYFSSTLYHLISNKKLKRRIKVLDHSAIYIKIAGSYTPFCILIWNQGGLWLLVLVWAMAIWGVISKVKFKIKNSWLSAVSYLGMGWVAIFAIKPLFDQLEITGFIFLLAGGLSYSFGVIFFLWEKLPYSHSIWHFFVLGGSIFHYLTVLFFIV